MSDALKVGSLYGDVEIRRTKGMESMKIIRKSFTDLKKRMEKPIKLSLDIKGFKKSLKQMEQAVRETSKTIGNIPMTPKITPGSSPVKQSTGASAFQPIMNGADSQANSYISKMGQMSPILAGFEKSMQSVQSSLRPTLNNLSRLQENLRTVSSTSQSTVGPLRNMTNEFLAGQGNASKFGNALSKLKGLMSKIRPQSGAIKTAMTKVSASFKKLE